MNDHDDVRHVVDEIVEAGMTGRLDDLASLLHDDVTMVLPGFGGRAEGKAAILAGYLDFADNAKVLSHDESRFQIDVVADVSVGTYRFSITYERDGTSYESTGRDMWIFRKVEGNWLAVWRTMLEAEERQTD